MQPVGVIKLSIGRPMLAALPQDVHHPSSEHQNIRSVWGILTLQPIVLAIITIRIFHA
jgi:hypothetical protein